MWLVGSVNTTVPPLKTLKAGDVVHLGEQSRKHCVRCGNLLEQLRRLDKLLGYGRLILTTNGILSLQLTYFMAFLNIFVFVAVNHLPFKEGMKHCLGRQYIVTTLEKEKDLLGKLELLLLQTNDSMQPTLFEFSTIHLKL